MENKIKALVEEILDNELDFSETWHLGIFNLPAKMEELKILFEIIYEPYKTVFFYKEFHNNLVLFKKHVQDRIEGKAKDYDFGMSWLELFNMRLAVNFKCHLSYVDEYIKGEGSITVCSEELPDFELN